MNSSQQENGLLQAGWDSLTEFRSSIVLTIVAALAMILYTSFAPGEKSAEAPFVGYRSFWEPTLLLRLRFCTRALPIVTEGYMNVRAFSAPLPSVSRSQSDNSVPVQEQHVYD